MGHIHVALAAPLGADDVAQAGRNEDQGAVTIGEGPDGPGAPADLAHDALEGIIGAQAAPVLRGKLEVLERLLDALGNDVGRAGELHLPKLGYDEHGLSLGRGTILLGMDCLQHGGHVPHLGRRHGGPHVPVEMHGTALPESVGIELGQRGYEAKALIADEELHSSKTTLLHVPHEVNPGGLILLGTLHDAENLTVAVLVDADGDQNAHVLYLAAPGALEPDPVEKDVGVSPSDRPVAPLLDLDRDLLV